MKGVNFGKIDRELKARKNKRNVNAIKDIDVSSLVNDFLSDNHDGFEKILRLHQDLKPDWVQTYNKAEEKKPKNIQTFINEDVTIEDIIDEASGDEITELAISTVISNRIAHYVTNIIRNKVDIYRQINHKKISKEEFNGVVRDLKRYFDPENKDRKAMLNHTEKNLLYKDIYVEDFDKEEMETLISIQNTVFALKDHAIQKLCVLLKERDDINYGIKKDEEKGIQAFVMDLPYYGQFAVHLKEPKLAKQFTEDKTKEYKEGKSKNKVEIIDEMDEVRKAIFELLKGKEYNQELYELQNIMLTSKVSNSGEDFLKSLRSLKTDEEKIAKINEIEDPRYRHYLLVKSGYDTRGDDNEPNIK